MTQGRVKRWLHAAWFPIAAGLLAFGWALLAWLTVFPNQDILADAIQVQSVLADPRLVWSFPGQKHAGPLEYPYSLLAEWLAPGNYYVLSAVRPVLAFATAALAALLFRRLFPSAPRWAFLAAVAVGPSILSGMLGPESNPVGVWWLQPNWDMAWLLVVAGSYVAARVSALAGEQSGQQRRRQIWGMALAGLLIALGFYAHPAISLLILPMLVLVALRLPFRPWMTLPFVAGGVVGVIPAAISYVVNSGAINTWDPSHGPMINVPLYVAALGLGGNPDYMLAVLPYAWGLTPLSTVIPPVGQSLAMWLLLIAAIAVAAIAVDRAIRNRRRVSLLGALAIAWLAAMAGIVLFATVVDPVWIYSSGLAILWWITVGALPKAIPWRKVGAILAGLAILVSGASTLAHNSARLTSIPSHITETAERHAQLDRLADALVAGGVEVIYGSYYDVIPIGYASDYRLRTISSTYNRFPAQEGEFGEIVRLAISTEPTDPWGTEALLGVREQCDLVDEADAALASLAVYDCPVAVLSDPPSTDASS